MRSAHQRRFYRYQGVGKANGTQLIPCISRPRLTSISNISPPCQRHSRRLMCVVYFGPVQDLLDRSACTAAIINYRIDTGLLCQMGSTRFFEHTQALEVCYNVDAQRWWCAHECTLKINKQRTNWVISINNAASIWAQSQLPARWSFFCAADRVPGAPAAPPFSIQV